MTAYDVETGASSPPRSSAEESKGGSEETNGPWAQLARVAKRLHSEGVSRGERAELRRMREDDVPPEIYWRLTEGLTWPPRTLGEREEFDPFWMAVLPLMVLNPHEPGAWPGKVLAKARAKGSRVERWLRRDRASAWAEARRLLSLAKGDSIDWTHFGYMLHAWDDARLKRRFARDFFRAGRSAGNTDREQEGES